MKMNLSGTIVAVGVAAGNLCAQGAAELEIEIYPGLTVVGEVGKVYSMEYVTDLAEPADSDWRGLEFLQLPASPYLWADTSAPATGTRLYRAVEMIAPTGMVFIPPGGFRMGSPETEVDRFAGEGPQMAVTLSQGFWMGRHEVTQAEYLEVMDKNPSWFNGVRDETDYGVDLTRPVEFLSWFNAMEYCAALTQRERAAGRILTNAVYRLPTEAEWEYACRAWTSTRFSYGDDPDYSQLPQYAWCGENSDQQTHAVGQKSPNPWGLYDMHGNVLEWCQDWYGDYPGGPQLDPQGPASGSNRVTRGGYWGPLINSRNCRSAHRNGRYPDGGANIIGFRVVLAPGPQQAE